VEEIQRESQNVLGMLREQDFQHVFHGPGIDVLLHKGTILKGMLPKLKSS
jgi:hypothetical protein